MIYVLLSEMATDLAQLVSFKFSVNQNKNISLRDIKSEVQHIQHLKEVYKNKHISNGITYFFESDYLSLKLWTKVSLSAQNVKTERALKDIIEYENFMRGMLYQLYRQKISPYLSIKNTSETPTAYSPVLFLNHISELTQTCDVVTLTERGTGKNIYDVSIASEEKTRFLEWASKHYASAPLKPIQRARSLHLKIINYFLENFTPQEILALSGDADKANNYKTELCTKIKQQFGTSRLKASKIKELSLLIKEEAQPIIAEDKLS